jgi:RNA polymerase sigma-70 factor (ECF subfamily)
LGEKELVQKVLRGDDKAAQQFVVEYRDYMYITCANILGYKDPDAEDMVQEAFIIAFQKLDKFEFRAPLKSWLAQICVYLCFRHIRKRARIVVKLDEELEDIYQTSFRERATQILATEDREHKLEWIRVGLLKINPECREIIELRDRQEKSYVDIGKTLKIPIGTVMSRLARCKKALKVLVKSMIGEQDE